MQEGSGNMNCPVRTGDFENGEPHEIEDRVAPRFTLLIRPAKLVVGDLQFVCVIRDISATGVSVRIFHAIEWNGPVALELQTGERHKMDLVWNRGSEAGFEFHHEVEVESVIGNASLYPKRDIRFAIEWPIKLHDATGTARPAKLHNISRQGARVEIAAPLALDQALRLEARGLPAIEARVRWREEGHYGLVFDTTFSLGELALTVERLQRGGAINPPPLKPRPPAAGEAA